MTQNEIQKYRAWGKRYNKVHMAAPWVLALCDEVERLQGLTEEQRERFHGMTKMPFGPHKGKLLRDIPAEYFNWWLDGHSNRAIIQLEAKHSAYPKKAIAQQNLKLFDYLMEQLYGKQNISEEDEGAL